MTLSTGLEIPSFISHESHDTNDIFNVGDDFGGPFGEFPDTTAFVFQEEHHEPLEERASEEQLRSILMNGADPEEFHASLLEPGVDAQEISEVNIPHAFHSTSPERESAFEKWRIPGCRRSPQLRKGKYSNKAMIQWFIQHYNKIANSKRVSPVPSPVPSQQDESEQLPQLQGEQSPPQQVVNSRERQSHNHMIAERNRRLKEKHLTKALLSLIPTELVKKKDKNSVFQYTIDYIKFLKSQVQEETSSMTSMATKFEEEVSKSTSGMTSGHMIIQDDGGLARLCVDTSIREKQPNMLLNMLTCAKGLGYEIESVQWSPKTSPWLTLTVHSTNRLVSTSQLAEALEKQMFISDIEAGAVRTPESI